MSRDTCEAPNAVGGWPTLVAGVGSPFGDDQAGWRVVELLKRRPELPARLKLIDDATQLLEDLEGCHRLVIIDACRSGRMIGTLTRHFWPDSRIANSHGHSTHGVSVFAAVQLAERLGRLPPQVEIFGIEAGDCEPGHEICLEVWRAVAGLEEIIFAELCQAANARLTVGEKSLSRSATKEDVAS